MGNLRLAQVPKEHYDKLFANLVKHRGVERAKTLVEENALLSVSFTWCFSDEGHKFWESIDEGESPTSNPKKVNKKIKTDTIAEAESKGFAIGVNTKFGKIREFNSNGKKFKHELCDDGSFFYYNIKVLSAKGKWCKPGKKEQRGQSSDASAIHTMLDEIFKFRK